MGMLVGELCLTYGTVDPTPHGLTDTGTEVSGGQVGTEASIHTGIGSAVVNRCWRDCIISK